MSAQIEIEPENIPAPKRAGAWTTGMALFSMFFGAGNLIFPLLVGVSAGEYTPHAVLGLGLSAVFFPLLGLVAMLFYQGNLQQFLARLGAAPAFALLLVLQFAMGPLGCVPRLIVLMHASIRYVLPDLSLGVFSVLICAAMFLLALRPNRMVHLLGAILTPLFLGMLAVLIVYGVIQGSPLLPASSGALDQFTAGLKGGYQTMDLIGSLLFATIVTPFLYRGTSHLAPEQANAQVRRTMMGASLVAALLLMACYIGLTFLAAGHASYLAKTAPEELLLAIANRVLGPAGALVAVATIFLACLTTAMSLVAVFSEYLRATFFARAKKSSVMPLVLTLALAGAVSNLGFSGLMKGIGPAMQILYPALIALCLANIAHGIGRMQSVKMPVYAALAVGVVGFLLR